MSVDPRFDTRLKAPPIRIGLAMARSTMGLTLRGHRTVIDGAGDYGMKEPRNAPVPIALRIDRHQALNSNLSQQATLPTGIAARKRGIPGVQNG